MNAGQALKYTSSYLSSYSVEDIHIEARTLLCHLLQISAAKLYAYPEHTLERRQIDNLEQLLKRRTSGEPLAYILGKREFFNLDFYVNRNVLIPRPETELLVNEAIKYCNVSHDSKSPVIQIADIGTGSGAIAVSLAVHLDNIKIYAVDISAEALNIARYNASCHEAAHKIEFIQGNLIENISEPLDLLCANLPYVNNLDLKSLPASIINYEPSAALDGGMDGLEIIRRLLSTCLPKLKRQSCILLEIGYDQSSAIADMIKQLFGNARLTFHVDMNGHLRVAQIQFCSQNI
jgi:release factor glutamine methyltransferase